VVELTICRFANLPICRSFWAVAALPGDLGRGPLPKEVLLGALTFFKAYPLPHILKQPLEVFEISGQSNSLKNRDERFGRF